MNSQDWPQALALWTRCIEDFDKGDHPAWHAAKARVLLRLERIEEAEQILTALIKDHSRLPAVHVGLAELAFHQQDWQLAASRWATCIQHFSQAIKPWWLAQYANSLVKLHRTEDARLTFQSLTRKFPDIPAGHVGLARLAHQEGDWSLAASCWEECIRRFDDGNKINWHKQYAQALMGMEKYAEAIEILDKLEQDAPSDANCMSTLAKANYFNQDMEKCLHVAGRLVKEQPHLMAGYYWCERALIKLGRFNEAADYYLARPDKKINTKPSPEPPSNFPAALVLPPIPGNGNDYTFIEEKLRRFQAGPCDYHLSVSVVIPVYNQAQMLARTLAALTHQTYPRQLIEVVIADDGSYDDIGTVLEKYRPLMNLRYVRQDDLGFRLSAVRNLGIKATTYDYVVLLDSDVMPTPTLIQSYMAVFHVTDKAVLMGLRTFVSTQDCRDDDLLQHAELMHHLPRVVHGHAASCLVTTDDRAFDNREPVLARTRNFKDAIFPFKYLTGCNLALPKSVFGVAGFFDEAFQAWGYEDIEFAYRVYNCGYYFIPVADALGLHQEPETKQPDDHSDRIQGEETTQPIFIQKCPLAEERQQENGKIYAVPRVSICIPAYNASEFTVDSVLGQTYTDLEVVICNDGSTDETLAVLERYYSYNPRVRWISQPHTGMAAATNHAVEVCRGMYIGQVHADDVLEPTAIASLVELLDQENIGLAYGDSVHVDRYGELIEPHHSETFSREHLMTAMICGAFRMFRKRDWNRISGCDESMTSAIDHDLALKFSEICAIAHLPQVTCRCRVHEASRDAAHRNAQQRNPVIAINKALDRMGLAYAWRAVEKTDSNTSQVHFVRLRNQDVTEPNYPSSAQSSSKKQQSVLKLFQTEANPRMAQNNRTH